MAKIQSQSNTIDLMSRSEAITKGLKWYFTGKPCKHGHISKRQVANKSCHECNKKSFAKWESSNLSQRAARKRNARKLNPDRAREVARLWRLATPQKQKEMARKNYLRNRHLFIAGSKKRKLTQSRNMPFWADSKKIREFYKEAARLTLKTGVKHHVDHIIPLNGKYVSGLHIPQNLQVITAQENLKKGNKCPL